MVEGTLIMIDYKKYLVFQPFFNCFTTPLGSGRILTWKSKGLSEESFKLLATSDNCLAPKLGFIHNGKIGMKFKGGCLKQGKTIFTHRNVVKLLIVYELDTW